MTTSLYLRPDNWDLALTAGGNIALCSAPYAQAQDAACAIRTFAGECWFDTTLGITYFEDILGKRPPTELIRAKVVAEALRVPGVVAAKAFLSEVGRTVSGQVQITDRVGNTAFAGF